MPEARVKLSKEKEWNNKFNKILYRLFDVRHIYYSPLTVDWGRPELMQHLEKENIALLTCRQIALNDWHHAFISKDIVDDSVYQIKQRKEHMFFLYISIQQNIRKKAAFNLQCFLNLKPNMEAKGRNQT